MIGPFRLPPIPNLILSPVGVVPKKAAGKFRLIQYLSYPAGQSVNDAIDATLSSVSYQSFESALALVQECGRGSLLAKIYIEYAFRLLPLHPESFQYMGFRHRGGYYIDRCLPMGCSISCALFEKFSGFLHWCIQAGTGCRWIAHYLDDFLVIGPPDSTGCRDILFSTEALFRVLGIPIAADKTEGPATCLSFLGIEIDTAAGICRLPVDKVSKMHESIVEVLGSSSSTLRQVQSLLGRFNFACRLIAMGRVFCRKLQRATAGRSRPHAAVRLSKVIREDLQIWLVFLREFNGSQIWPTPTVTNSSINLFTDASGACGFGAYLDGHWCPDSWPEEWHRLGITKNLLVLELFPIVVAIELWAPALRGKHIVFWCNNLGVVQSINKQSASAHHAISLLRHFVLRCLQHDISFRARHVPGVQNGLADALSCFQWSKFRSLAPQADSVGIPCPSCVWQIIAPV
ncbi:uncharacterized protein LOC142149556 [Mixophyes fleayi]|uniref:uncharacterized protein LOC142149556 n=1 Tax=Mixophyes fleayi TaxID=3061075 RepID=UPI003F4DA368